MASFADKIRCPHCLEELDYLEDPKELPCSHVFCMPCLESITSKTEVGVQTTCSICSATQQVATLSVFESARDKSRTRDLTTTTDRQADQEVPVISCDKCDKNAVSYCKDCDRKLCSDHEKLHQLFFVEETTLHKLISIQSYSTKVNMYVKPLCQTHQKEYAMCCRNCFSVICQMCTVKTKCAPESGDGADDKTDDEADGKTDDEADDKTDGKADDKTDGKIDGQIDDNTVDDTDDKEEGMGHYYHTLTDTATQLREEFESLLRDCSKKLTDMCKLEKQTWQEVDETKEACDELIEKVNTKSEELMLAVRSGRQTLIKKITAFKTLKTVKGESHLEGIRSHRETLGDMMVDCDQFIKSNHVVKVVQGRKRRRLELEESLKTSYKSDEFAQGRAQIDLRLWENLLKHYMSSNFTSVAVPRYLEYFDSIKAPDGCLDLQFCGNADLQLASQRGIKIYSRYNSSAKTLLEHVSVHSVANDPGNNTHLYFMTSGTKTDSRAVYEYDAHQPKQTPTELFSFQKSGLIDNITASNSMIVATDNQELVIYHLKTKKQNVVKVGFKPGSVHFISDELLLVTELFSNLHLLRLIDGNFCVQHETIWTSNYLPGALAVCTTHNGLIAVSSYDDMIHILSPRGETLMKLTDDMLPELHLGGISIHGDILAVACPKQNEFRLFRLY